LSIIISPIKKEGGEPFRVPFPINLLESKKAFSATHRQDFSISMGEAAGDIDLAVSIDATVGLE